MLVVWPDDLGEFLLGDEPVVVDVEQVEGRLHLV